MSKANQKGTKKNASEQDKTNHPLPEIQLLLKCVDKLSKQHCITPDYNKISEYIQSIPTIDFDDEEKRIRKAKYLLNKQIYEEYVKKNGQNRLNNTPEYMEKLNAIWDFSRAGKSFVMSVTIPNDKSILKKNLEEGTEPNPTKPDSTGK